MIILNNSNLTFPTFFKIFFIFFLLIINIYIFYNENIIQQGENKISNVKLAGILDSSIAKTLKSFGSGIAGAAGVYGAAITYKNENLLKEKLAKDKKELEKYEEAEKQYNLNISNLENKNSDIKNKIMQNKIEIENKINELKEERKSADIATDDYIQNISNKKISSEELERLRENMETLRHRAARKFDSLKDSSDKFESLFIEDLPKKSFVGSELLELYESLSAMGKLAISLLILNYAVISSLITIIFIFYGDYLLKKYNIQEKYPKLAKFIELRKKFQRYYLFSAIFIITFVAVVEIIFCLYVLTI